MTGLAALWLPIVLSAVFVFIASSLVHMVLPWHKSDYPKMPNEDAVAGALRPLAIPPGDYFFPKPASRDDLRSPEFAKKMEQGPVVMMTVMPNGQMRMGRNFTLWILYCLAMSVCAAYITLHAITPGPTWRQIFRFAGATAFIGYTAALWQMSIWYWRAWSITIKATIDGLIYSVITAATFVWLWPR